MTQKWQLLSDDLIAEIAASGDRDWLILENHYEFKGQWIVNCLNPGFFFDFQNLVGPYRAVSPRILADFMELASNLGYKVAFGEDPTTILNAYEALNEPPAVSLNSDLLGTVNGLLPYQVQGFNFFKDLHAGVALWSTGLGKTALACALLKYHIDVLGCDVAFFVVKSHNKVNTQRSLMRLASLDSVVLDGPKQRRQDTFRDLFKAPRGTVVVTNYEKFRVDYDEIIHLTENRNVLFIWDEMPTKLKNRQTQLYKRVRKVLYHGNHPNWDKIRAKNLTQYMLSATPIENNPEDFYACVRLMDPRIYGSLDDFHSTYVSSFDYFDTSKPAVWCNLAKMGMAASHITHQIDKEDSDIAAQFPAVIQEPFYIDWDSKDRTIYDKVANAVKTKLEGEAFGENTVLALISVMQMLCDAPSMVNNSAVARMVYEDALRDFMVEEGETGVLPLSKGSDAALELLSVIGEPLSDERHTKIDTLAQLITDEHKDEKIVVFSAYNKALLPILSKCFDEWGVTYVTYRGTAEQKQAALDAFCADPGIQVFLSSDAGSDSINLEQASVVIHYDLPWKYSTLIQRQNRIHRITSEFDKVRYYMLLMENSIEERKLKIIKRKHDYHLRMFKGTVADEMTTARMTREDLLYILGG